MNSARRAFVGGPGTAGVCRGPFFGAVIVYRAKRGDRIKILVCDISGLVLVWKQLNQGAFRWPPVVDGVMRLSPVEFAALFDGLDWTRVQTAQTDSETDRCRVGFGCNEHCHSTPQSLPDDLDGLRALIMTLMAGPDAA